MSSLTEREEAFELKFVHDQELRFKALARRNRLLGQWVGKRMDLGEVDIEDYVNSILKADLGPAGNDALVGKILGDFQKAQLDMTEDELRQKMADLLALASEQVKD